jgi:cell wall-associated NlpC family hydrolase
MRARVLAEARTWATPRTPFAHQSRKKGAGVDCLGLVWAVGERAGAMPRVSDREAKPFWRFYGRRPNPPVMRRCLARFLREIPAGDARPGDLAWMHWEEHGMPIHMAILAEHDGRPMLIHSVWEVGVVEHGMEAAHRERIYGWWRYPAIAAAEAA